VIAILVLAKTENGNALTDNVLLNVLLGVIPIIKLSMGHTLTIKDNAILSLLREILVPLRLTLPSRMYRADH